MRLLHVLLMSRVGLTHIFQPLTGSVQKQDLQKRICVRTHPSWFLQNSTPHPFKRICSQTLAAEVYLLSRCALPVTSGSISGESKSLSGAPLCRNFTKKCVVTVTRIQTWREPCAGDSCVAMETLFPTNKSNESLIKKLEPCRNKQTKVCLKCQCFHNSFRKDNRAEASVDNQILVPNVWSCTWSAGMCID